MAANCSDTIPCIAKSVAEKRLYAENLLDRPAGKQDRSCTLVAKPPSFSRSNNGKKVFA